VARATTAEGARGAGFLSRHALLLIVLAGAAVRFATIGGQGFWLDEYVTVHMIRQSPTDLLNSVVSGESNPALYYVLAGGWERIFGSTELGVRSLTALLGTATIPVVYAAANYLGSRRAGLIAAAITAASPMLIWYSQEARNYALFGFLAAVSFLCFVRALEEQRGQRWLWGWALASALTLCTHYFALFLIVPQAAWLLLRRPGSRFDTVLAGGAIVVVGIALLPLLFIQHGRGSWIAAYNLSDRLVQVPEHFLIGLQVPWRPIPVGAIVLVGGAIAFGAARARAESRQAIAIPWSVCLGGFALALLAIGVGQDFVLSRNVIGLWPPFAVGLALVLGGDRIQRLGIATATILCAAGLGLAIWTATTPGTQRPNYSDLAAEIGPTAERRLIVSQTSFSAPLLLYLDGLHIATGNDLKTSKLIVIDPRPTKSYAVGLCWWLDTCGGVDVSPPPPFKVPVAFELQRNGSTRLFDYRVYTAPRPVRVTRPVEYLIPRIFVQLPSQ
jgi:mannosyltransferase